MESNRFLLLLLFFLHSPFTSSTYISDDVFAQSQWGTGRTLLQQQSECSIDFEKLNYTEITSVCKGPNYQKEPCCKGLKNLACPHSKDISNLRTNCAKTMFSYVNLYGKYPPGLFSSLCVEEKEGLNCKDTLKELEQRKSAKNRASQLNFHRFSFLIPITVLLILSPTNIPFIVSS